MAELIEWLPDGTPYSPRYGDRYRSELGGLAQSREVFLRGCDLPGAWAGQPQWCVLETGFGLGLNFLVTWQAWKINAQRPRLLHFVSTELHPASAADVLRAASSHPELMPMAEQLQAQLWGLLPGIHRLVFEQGQVLLTLCVGHTASVLRGQELLADSVYLDGFSPARNPDMWDMATFKAVARCCRRGSRIASWTVARSVLDGLQQCGFEVQKTTGLPPKRDNLQGVFNPRWEPRRAAGSAAPLPVEPGSCVVVGAGLAGAATAASLARRGWRVCVLDAHAAPAGGASGLPAGLLVPHVSPDDSLLSRLSRSGVRATLQQAQALLRPGLDWQASGVLERRLDGSSGLPADWPEAGRDWSQPASAAQLQHIGSDSAAACWHQRAGWVKPASLVSALLAQPGISWRGNVDVTRLEREPGSGLWQLFGSQGQLYEQASLVVLAAAYASNRLVQRPLPLQAIRGQVSWGLQPANQGTADAAAPGFPDFPVNGHGSFLPGVPSDEGPVWLAGAGFTRDSNDSRIEPQDQLDNLARLQVLLPGVAAQLAADFKKGKVRAWAGVRCASPDRLPVVGPVDPAQQAGLWINSAMGSRGLSFAVLCAELLAARLHHEPLPLDTRMAQALSAQRFSAG